MRALFALLVLLPLAARADPMAALPDYDRSRLLGSWVEMAATPSLLEVDCHGTRVAVASRDDSRLTLKIACHKGALTGKLLPLEGIMVETAPGTFDVRFVRLSALGNLTVMVLWQSADDSVVALGSPFGDIGWVWARTAAPDPASVQAARAALVAGGYVASAIRPVDQGN